MELLRDPDAELVRRCQSADGDFEEAFEALFHRYRDRVYSIAFRVTGSGTDALDVVQESFSLLFRKIESFRFDSLFSTWLFRIVVNCSIDHRRRESSRTRRPDSRPSTLPATDDPVDDGNGPVEHAEVSELGDHVQAAIQQLSPKLRVILVLRYLEGMSYEELASTLAVSMGTVKSRLARAHMALERLLRGTLEPYGIAEDPASSRGGVA